LTKVQLLASSHLSFRNKAPSNIVADVTALDLACRHISADDHLMPDFLFSIFACLAK
jgi:hypothetical protein